MSLIPEYIYEESFVQRIAPFFYNDQDDDPIKSELDAAQFRKLVSAFEHIPGIKRHISMDCINLFIAHDKEFGADNIFYYMFKYYGENSVYCNGQDIRTASDIKQNKLVNEIFNDHPHAVSTMLDMFTIDTAFTLSDKPFNPARHHPEQMDMYRLEKAITMKAYHDHFGPQTSTEFTKNLNDLTRLGPATAPFVQNKMNNVMDYLLDHLSAQKRQAKASNHFLL